MNGAFEAGVAGGTAGLILAAILIGLTNPWQYVLASEPDEDDGGYDPTGGMADTPMDSPMRSADYCWGHGKIEERDN